METLVNFAHSYAANGVEVAVRQRRGYRMETWTYTRIGAEANRVARELSARGIAKGDTVLLWGPSSAEWIIAFLGCLLHGAIVVPIDDGASNQFAWRVSQEVNAALMFRSRAHDDFAAVAPIDLESLCERMAGHDASLYPSPPFSRKDTLEIIFTSGTTAEPRGVVITHGNILATIETLRR